MPPQPLDASTHSMPALLRDARIQEVRQPLPNDIVLATHGPAGGAHWLLSVDPIGARCIQTFAPGKNAPQPGQFLLWLRTRLAGARVEGLTVVGGQVADLALQGKDGAFHLVLEVNGRESNLLLLDGSRHVLAMLHPGTSKMGIGSEYAPPPRLHRYPKSDPPRLPVNDGTAARALDAQWRTLVTEQTFQAARDEGLRRIKSILGKLRRRLEHIEGDRDAAQGAEGVREQAELLQIHRHRLKPGMAEVTVPDEFAPERPDVTISLDPSLGPTENIERLFHRYQKQRDAVIHVERRLQETREETSRWEALQSRLAGAKTAAEWDALIGGLSTAERKVVVPPPPKARDEDAAASVMTRTSADGYTIFVGRSKTENDEVTFRIGRGRDWWLHALGVPGAHVVVRNPNNGSLPPATLRQAAWLAAYYSKGRKQGGLEVTCTQRKHVRKVKGGEPGQVTHALGLTVWVDLDDAQARAVLGEVEGSDLDV